MRKADAYYATIKDDRNAWKAERLAEYPHCWICGTRHDLVVHEMAKRSQAPYKWGERCNYFLTCNTCNCGILESLDIGFQLAFKEMRDYRHYNRERVNELRGRAPDAVSERDVSLAFAQMAQVAFIEKFELKQPTDFKRILRVSIQEQRIARRREAERN